MPPLFVDLVTTTPEFVENVQTAVQIEKGIHKAYTPHSYVWLL